MKKKHEITDDKPKKLFVIDADFDGCWDVLFKIIGNPDENRKYQPFFNLGTPCGGPNNDLANARPNYVATIATIKNLLKAHLLALIKQKEQQGELVILMDFSLRQDLVEDMGNIIRNMTGSCFFSYEEFTKEYEEYGINLDRYLMPDPPDNSKPETMERAIKFYQAVEKHLSKKKTFEEKMDTFIHIYKQIVEYSKKNGTFIHSDTSKKTILINQLKHLQAQYPGHKIEMHIYDDKSSLIPPIQQKLTELYNHSPLTELQSLPKLDNLEIYFHHFDYQAPLDYIDDHNLSPKDKEYQDAINYLSDQLENPLKLNLSPHRKIIDATYEETALILSPPEESEPETEEKQGNYYTP